MFCLFIYTIEREWEGEIAAPEAGRRSLVLEADWVFVVNSVGLPQPKVDFVNILVIIGSVLVESVNCHTNLVFCQYNVLF